MLTPSESVVVRLWLVLLEPKFALGKRIQYLCWRDRQLLQCVEQRQLRLDNYRSP